MLGRSRIWSSGRDGDEHGANGKLAANTNSAACEANGELHQTRPCTAVTDLVMPTIVVLMA
jgi:hypothetical protein